MFHFEQLFTLVGAKSGQIQSENHILQDVMRKIIYLILLVFVMPGCEYTILEKNDEEDNKDVGKEDVLDIITSFKESLYELGASNSAALKVYASPVEEDSVTVHSKDELVESKMNVGYDIEWLDMAVLVLSFAEIFTTASDTLGEETNFYDVLDDPGIWGWQIYDSTKVILDYSDKVLYLRVIDDMLIQTFFFEYIEEDLIKIFRLFEQRTPRGNFLYVEDFIEKTGLSSWNTDGEYFFSSRVNSDDGGLYTIWSSGTGAKTFGIANYVLDSVPVYIVPSGEALYAEYDFKYVDLFDSFTEEGVLFQNEDTVQMPLMMNVTPVYDGSDMYVLTGSKLLSEPTHSLEVEEANIRTELTYEDIRSNIDSLLNISELGGISYDYSLGVDLILKDLSDLLYLDYGVSE